MDNDTFPVWFMNKYVDEVNSYMSHNKKTWIRIRDVYKLQEEYLYNLQVLKNRLDSYSAKIMRYEERIRKLEEVI